MIKCILDYVHSVQLIYQIVEFDLQLTY